MQSTIYFKESLSRAARPKPICRSTRRDFLRNALIVALTGSAIAQRTLAQGGGAAPGLIQWARLKTAFAHWDEHHEQDETVVRMSRETAHLPMDPKPVVVTADDVNTMSQFPFIFSVNLAALERDDVTANAQEYLRRGGFFYVDCCVAWEVTRNPALYFRRHVELFHRISPGSEIRLLEESAPIFHSIVKVDEVEVRSGHSARGHWDDVAQGLYGVFQGTRLVSLLSMDHLWCGWPQDQPRMNACLKEIANIYVFAMTR